MENFLSWFVMWQVWYFESILAVAPQQQLKFSHKARLWIHFCDLLASQKL